MKKYYLYEGGIQLGPFSLEELQQKKITTATSVWFHPMPGWKPAGEIDELKIIFSNGIAQPVAVPASTDDWTKKQYYYADNAGQYGPFRLEQLLEKNLNANTAIWFDPLPEWTTIGKVAGLKDMINRVQANPAPVVKAPDPVAKVEDLSRKQFYFADNSGQHGPFPLEQLLQKNIDANTPVWYDPLPEWTIAGKVTVIKDALNKVPAAPVPVVVNVEPASQQDDWNNKKYFYADDAGQHGPLKLDQLKEKNIQAETPIWYDPLHEWTTAGKVEGLKNIIIKPANTVQPPSIAESSLFLLILSTQYDAMESEFTIQSGESSTKQKSLIINALRKWSFYKDFSSPAGLDAAIKKYQHIKNASVSRDAFIIECAEPLKKYPSHRDITFYQCAEIVFMKDSTNSPRDGFLQDLKNRMEVNPAVAGFITDLEGYLKEMNS